MTGFLLDTNVLSEFSRKSPEPRVDRWLQSTREESLFVSVMTMAEIRRGIELLPAGKRRTELEEWQNELHRSFEDRLLPVTSNVAERWARLSVQAQLNGTPLAIIDGLIAATAVECDLIMVTRNTRDFTGFGVRIFNPW